MPNDDNVINELLGGGLPSRLVHSSSELGWNDVRVEEYEDPPVATPFTTRASTLTLVRVTTGRYRIESKHGRRWLGDDYRPGSVGVTAPGNENVLRWRTASDVVMRSQHVHLEPSLAPDGVRFPDTLALDDPFVTACAQALEEALRTSAPSVYADSVAAALVAHLVHRAVPAARSGPKAAGLGAGEVTLVVDFMRAHLDQDIALDEMAALIGLSKFHFLRMFATTTGETPSRYLTRLRLSTAADLLRKGGAPISEIAGTCGYRSPGQFAAAFRREHGCSPGTFRRQMLT